MEEQEKKPPMRIFIILTLLFFAAVSFGGIQVKNYYDLTHEDEEEVDSVERSKQTNLGISLFLLAGILGVVLIVLYAFIKISRRQLED